MQKTIARLARQAAEGIPGAYEVLTDFCLEHDFIVPNPMAWTHFPAVKVKEEIK
jgi:hypothetical protein